MAWLDAEPADPRATESPALAGLASAAVHRRATIQPTSESGGHVSLGRKDP